MTIVDINCLNYYNQINGGSHIMVIIIKFKYRLKELRKEYKMTQEELAGKLGLVRTAIANYETGRTSPDSETLSLIANIFNTTTDYLLGRTDIKQPIENIIKEQNKTDSSSDEITEEIRNLSPESQEELKKLIELYKLKDMQKRNSDIEIADDLTSTK